MMVVKYKYLLVALLCATCFCSCKKDDLTYVDPMLDGLNKQALKTADELDNKIWSEALIALKEPRIKLFGTKKLISEGKYTDDLYTVKNPQEAIKKTDEAIAQIDFKIDSIWNVNIKNDFDALNVNSEGIKVFGLTEYNLAKEKTEKIYTFLKSESIDSMYLANDLELLKSEIAVLSGLSALSSTEVLAYINDLKALLALLKKQYADLASPIATSNFFTTAQKNNYTSLNQRLNDIEAIILSKPTLKTKNSLDDISSDISALVNYVANNYTTLSKKPIVVGEISDIAELRWLSEIATDDEKTGNWTLKVDIDATETIRWNKNTSIPGFQSINKFNGTFDGQNHIINGIYMTDAQPLPFRAGFFDRVDGNILNLGLTNIYIKNVNRDATQGGALVGFMTKGGTISNCFAHGTMERTLNSGGLVGRVAGNVTIKDCFSAVNMSVRGTGSGSTSSSFIGYLTGNLILKNCYTIGANPTRVVFGIGENLILREASGIYYDPASVGNTLINSSGYRGNTVVRLTDPGVVTSLPTNKWDNLSNFPGFSSNIWGIKTVTDIDSNPRPYLIGFNYDLLIDFLKP